jgi:hypothetical protein
MAVWGWSAGIRSRDRDDAPWFGQSTVSPSPGCAGDFALGEGLPRGAVGRLLAKPRSLTRLTPESVSTKMLQGSRKETIVDSGKRRGIVLNWLLAIEIRFIKREFFNQRTLTWTLCYFIFLLLFLVPSGSLADIRTTYCIGDPEYGADGCFTHVIWFNCDYNSRDNFAGFYYCRSNRYRYYKAFRSGPPIHGGRCGYTYGYITCSNGFMMCDVKERPHGCWSGGTAFFR